MFNLENTYSLSKQLYKPDFYRFSPLCFDGVNLIIILKQKDIVRVKTGIFHHETVIFLLHLKCTRNFVANTQKAEGKDIWLISVPHPFQ